MAGYNKTNNTGGYGAGTTGSSGSFGTEFSSFQNISGTQSGGLQEKAMVNDALASVKNSLSTYAKVISECSSPNLRSAIQQIRNNCETSQYELYKIAQSKGYYQPAVMADDNEVQQVKSEFGG